MLTGTPPQGISPCKQWQGKGSGTGSAQHRNRSDSLPSYEYSRTRSTAISMPVLRPETPHSRCRTGLPGPMWVNPRRGLLYTVDLVCDMHDTEVTTVIYPFRVPGEEFSRSRLSRLATYGLVPSPEPRTKTGEKETQSRLCSQRRGLRPRRANTIRPDENLQRQTGYTAGAAIARVGGHCELEAGDNCRRRWSTRHQGTTAGQRDSRVSGCVGWIPTEPLPTCARFRAPSSIPTRPRRCAGAWNE